MPLTVKMVASEILMCGLKQAPLVGPVVEVLESIRFKLELVEQAHRLAEIEERLSSIQRSGAIVFLDRCKQSSTSSGIRISVVKR